MDSPAPGTLVLAPVTDFLGDIVVRRMRKLGAEPARFSSLDRARAALARLDPVLLVIDVQSQPPDDLLEFIAAAKASPTPRSVILIGQPRPARNGVRVWEDAALVEPFEVGALLTLLEREWAACQAAIASGTTRARLTFPNTAAAIDAACAFLALFTDPLGVPLEEFASFLTEFRTAGLRAPILPAGALPPNFDAHLLRDARLLTCTVAPGGRRIASPVVLRLAAPPPLAAPALQPVPEAARPAPPEPMATRDEAEAEEPLAPIVAEGGEWSEAPLIAPAEESLESILPEPAEIEPIEIGAEEAPAGEAEPLEEIVPLQEDATPVASKSDSAPEVEPIPDDVLVSWAPPEGEAPEEGFDAGRILDSDASEVAAEQPWVLEITDRMAGSTEPPSTPVEEPGVDETPELIEEAPLPAGEAAPQTEEPGPAEEPAGVAAEAPKEESGFLPAPKFDSPVRYEPETPPAFAPETPVAVEPVSSAATEVPGREQFGSAAPATALALLSPPAAALPLPPVRTAVPSTGFERLARWLVFLLLAVTVGIVAWVGPEMMAGAGRTDMNQALAPLLDRASGVGEAPDEPRDRGGRRGPAVSGPGTETVPVPVGPGGGSSGGAIGAHAEAIRTLREAQNENDMTQALVFLAKEQSVDAEAVPLLIRVIEGNYPDTMKEIALWALETSAEPSALEGLLSAIREGSDRARHRAVLALHAKPQPEATQALVEVLHLASPPATKTVAINLLATREPGSADVLAALARQMDAADKAIRRAAIQALGRRTEAERDRHLLNAIPQLERDELIIDIFGALQSSTDPQTLRELQNYRTSPGAQNLSPGAVTILETTIQVLMARLGASLEGR